MGLLIVPLGGMGGAAADIAAAWPGWRDRFVASDGRVVDTGNKGISHSEGQGTGMLLAAAAADRPTFERVWRWTRANLDIRGDGLLAWRWHPDANPAVPDRNNATDGDLLAGWALALAAERWHEVAYRNAASGVAGTIRRALLRQTAIGPVLLPGAGGFEVAEGTILNLSYAVLPAFRALDRVDPDPVWQALADSHRALLERARLGIFSLPPDWLLVPTGWDGAESTLKPAPGWPPRFGYDAVRVPLYLVWSGADGAMLWPFRKFWKTFAATPFLPAWADVVEDTVPTYDSSVGIHAIAQLVARVTDDQTARLPPPSDTADYYAASLAMLAQLAWTERGLAP